MTKGSSIYDREIFKLEMKFSLDKTVAGMGTSATLASKMRVSELRNQGNEVISFGIGESPFPVPNPIGDALQKNINHTRYQPTAGIQRVREEIAEFNQRHFGIHCSAEDILVGPGSKELLFDIMMATDYDWIIPAPGWLSYASQLKITGRRYFKYSSSVENEYRFSEKLIRDTFNHAQDVNDGKQMALVINYPNNPTGMTLSSSEVERIARFARNNEIMVLSDEIYANINHTQEKHRSIALDYPEGTIVSGGISKDRSLAGWRFGTLVLPPNPELKKAIRTIGSETFSCVSAPIQFAMITAFSDNEEINQRIEDSSKLHGLMGQITYNLLKDEYKVSKPEGAFYLLPSLNHKKDILEDNGINTSRELVTEILEQKHVALIAAQEFGMQPEDLAFRLAYIDYDGKGVMNSFTKDRDTALDDPMAFVKSHAPTLLRGLNNLVDFSQSL